MTATFAPFDQLKIQLLLGVRAVNRLAIERWSGTTFRRPQQSQEGMPPLEPASRHYRSTVLPPALMVPTELPASSRLKGSYVVPYYVLAGTFFRLYQNFPLRDDVPWSPDVFPSAFPAHPEGWNDIQSDANFTALRLQGPNPFLLTRAPDGLFVVDYAPFFEGVFEPVRCFFRVEGQRLVPDRITQGERVWRPGEAGWERAKFVANGLDARFTVFLRHLEHTHLITGQAFALSAFALPVGHPVRVFVEFFTYSTLVVNDFAFKLLVTPASYFLQSNFLSADHVARMFANFVPHYRLEQLMPPHDIAHRGIDAIPHHPYVEDSLDIWQVLATFSRDYLKRFYPDDAAVAADSTLQRWYAALVELLPDRTVETHPLDQLERLVETLSALVYLNVSHEICGDFSPYTMSSDPAQKKLVNFENLQHDSASPPRAADVFLFDQGAYAGRFENTANYLLGIDVDACVPDHTLRSSLRWLQRRLEQLDATLAARNATRATPFLRMQPRCWQTSISY